MWHGVRKMYSRIGSLTRNPPITVPMLYRQLSGSHCYISPCLIEVRHWMIRPRISILSKQAEWLIFFHTIRHSLESHWPQTATWWETCTAVPRLQPGTFELTFRCSNDRATVTLVHLRHLTVARERRFNKFCSFQFSSGIASGKRSFDTTQQTHNVETTSIQRWIDVVSTLCMIMALN